MYYDYPEEEFYPESEYQEQIDAPQRSYQKFGKIRDPGRNE